MYYINNAHLQLPVEFRTFSYSLMHVYSIHQITYIAYSEIHMKILYKTKNNFVKTFNFNMTI